MLSQYFHKSIATFFLLTISLVMLSSCGNKADSLKKLKIGDIAPDFMALDLAGQQVSMSSLRGNPIVLRFWSVDCKYCRADTPFFNVYYKRYKDQGLKVFYVNILSEENEVQKFIKDLDIQFPVLLDKDGRIAALYQIKLVPQTIIINPDHEIVAAQLGGVGEEELRLFLEPYLEWKLESE